ncbi:MAG: pyridoxal-phosphate dependent enzyme [Planctomycetota bacterium]
MRIHENILEAIGRTPLVRLNRLSAKSRGTVVAKLEAFNPGGSVKDRIAVHMVNEAERTGKLKQGGTIVECTSGNTGLGLALTASVRGYKAIFTMPDKVAAEKSSLLKAFGAEVILCPTAVEPDDSRSYYSVARRLAEEIENSFYPNQYENEMNPDAHYRTTGPEIWEDTGGRVTHLVAGMGTGGTISGIGRYLKEQNPEVRIIGADPVGSLYHEYARTGKLGEAHSYLVEGIGEDMIPGTIDFDIIDEVIQAGDRESFQATRRLAREEAIFSGSSAGTAICAASKVAETLSREDLLVVLIPDTGERYLSKVYNEDWLLRNQLIDSRIPHTAAEVLAHKRSSLTDLLTVSPDSPVQDVITLMREHDISQVPVFEGGRSVGTVREAAVIELLLSGGEATSRPARDVMEGPLPILEESASADEILSALRPSYSAVLIEDAAGGHRIITKWDLIHSISGKRS